VSPASTATDKKTATEGADQKPTLMLLDGNSLAFRAFYALPAENFKTQGGLTTNAVYGFTAMLINLLRDEQPSHIAAAFRKPSTVIMPGINDPKMFGPANDTARILRFQTPCAPCFRSGGCEHMACIRGVTAEDATVSVLKGLDLAASRPA